MKRREFICTEKNPDSSHSNYAEEQRWLDRRILLSGEWSPMLLLRRMEVVELKREEWLMKRRVETIHVK